MEQLVRVYPINEEQYEKLMQLTNGKNVISEARLTSAGFTAVRNSLDSGWNSLLRIMGLTTTSRSDVAKIDIDGQPLCVMKRSFDDTESRATADDDSVINCIVVLKKDPALETPTVGNSNPSFAPYWYQESAAATPVQMPQDQLSVDPQASQLMPEQVAAPEAAQVDDEEREVHPPKIEKRRSKPEVHVQIQIQAAEEENIHQCRGIETIWFSLCTSNFSLWQSLCWCLSLWRLQSESLWWPQSLWLLWPTAWIWPVSIVRPTAFLSAKSFCRTTFSLQSVSLL